MKQGLTLPDFRKYVGATLYHWPALPTKEERKKGKKTGGYEIGTHDHLLIGERYPGMIGGKNGWTSHALGSFVGAATRGGHTIIIALMHAQSDFWPDARTLLNWGFAEREKAEPVGTLVNPIPPPAAPKPAPKTIASKPASALETSPGDHLDWWKIGLPAAAGVAIIAGVAVGARRRRHPSAAGPDPAEDGFPHFTPPPEKSPPRGDVKVAGAPLTPGDENRPASWETVPNPVQDPEDTVAEEIEEIVADPEKTVADPPRRQWTVRLPEPNGERGPFEPTDEES
jgi:D-alanyl-D-alanine carboxypeptidase (penicillin-binding protein 5/6)